MTYHEPEAGAEGLLDEAELQALRHLVPSAKLPARPKRLDVFLAVARLGGQLCSNGEPGWLRLGRGLEQLLRPAEGWRAAMLAVQEGAGRRAASGAWDVIDDQLPRPGGARPNARRALADS